MDQNKQIKPWPLEAKVGLGLSITAALVVGGVLIFGKNSNPNINTEVNKTTSSQNVEEEKGSTEKVVDTQMEVLKKPYLVNVKIARYYYDMSDDLETRANAIVMIQNQQTSYIKNVGVDYNLDGKTFDVIAACSGTVKERINDATYGNMLVIQHESGLKTIYASLSSFNVQEGSKVNQGQVIAKSGESLFTSEIGNSLHFEIMKDGKYINPEKAYSLEVKAI